MTFTADSRRAWTLTVPEGRVVRTSPHAHGGPAALARPTGVEGRRGGARRAIRVLVVLALSSVCWLAVGATARAAVGVPVIIDSFDNPNVPAGPFTRAVVPIGGGTFSQSTGLGTMNMSEGTSANGVTLSYTPTAGGSVDLTGGGSNGQIFIDFALINGSAGGVTVSMTAFDASGHAGSAPSDGIGNVFAFNAAFPFSGFPRAVDFTHITRLDFTFVYPVTNSGVPGSLVVEVNKLWASPISGAQPSPPSPMVTAPATELGMAGALVDFTVSFGSNEGAAPVTNNPPSDIGVRAQDLSVSGSAFGGTAPHVRVSGGPSTYTVVVSGMTTSGGVTVHVPAGIVDDAWAQLNTASSNDPTVAFTLEIPPEFQSANNATFAVGASATFTADATGGQPAPAPTPALSIGSGSLPPGLTFHDNGNGTASIAGQPAAGTGGVVALTLKATNVAGTVTQNFRLTVDEPPTITSAGAATFTVGSPGSVNITTGHDYPAATTLSIPGGSLPAGVAFTDNGNGTATISGTPAPGDGGRHTFNLTASNGITPNAVQPFTLTIDQPPTTGSSTTGSSTTGAPAISRTAIVGATLSFTLNQAARVTFTFTRQPAGRKVDGKCVAQTRRNHRKRFCKRTVTVGSITLNGRTGINRVAFTSVRIHGRKLRRGRYTVLITTTNPATGTQSKPQRLSFTIAK